MKKITFLMIALLAAVVTFAALMGKQSESPFKTLDKAEMVKAQKLIPATKALDRKAMPMRNGVRKAEAELVTPPETATVETYYTVDGGFYVGTSSGWSDYTSSMATVNVAVDGTDMYIQGLAYWFEDAWVKGTIDGATVTFPSGQLLGTDEYGDEFLVGSDDVETVTDIIFNYNSEEGILTAVTAYIIENGAQDGLTVEEDGETYSTIYCYWYQPVFSTTEPEIVVPEVVEAPEGLETEEYVISARNYKDDADVSGSVLVGFDGSDVYIQGLCTYIPEAWAKGTLDGATVTFATGQYFGTYASTYDMYLNVLMGEDVVFDYDAEAGTLTAQNEFFLVDNDEYYFDSYRGAVLKKVVEKAAMPANPAITALTNGSYGWYITFNVPNVDTEGDGLASSKLSYMIYTDIEGEIAPLTFTPETHTYLTEDMTEIPFGFTENWDFYDNAIYLNELYSEDWNNIGIQSIYRGGGEENVTEIQWFHIKDYAAPAGGDFTFDFNKMDVATSSNVTQDGDINEALTLTEGNATLTISPKDESATTPNRFWSTSAGPQLRVYSGTLTFEVPEGSNITKIEFNTARWNDSNSADSGEFDGTTWTGKAQTVKVSIAGNTQINSIVVTVEVEGGVEPVNPDALVYDFEDGTMQGWTTIDADGDGYTWLLGSAPSINTVNESSYSVYSQSYASSALTPDNFLVSPKMKLDGSISFYACAQDGSYPAEKFAVAVSTASNNDAADFTNVQEWTMTASRVDNVTAEARGMFRSPKKTPGNWYKYTVDLSSFEGVEGYVAIRHFDCTDNFYLVVDDIELVTSEIILPDFTITPAEGVVKSLSDFEITFNNYDITVAEDATATLTNATSENTYNTSIKVEENAVLISFDDEITEPGEYTLSVAGVKTAEGEPIELTFYYTIEKAPEVVVLPEGLEAETWYFSAKASQSNVRNQEVAVAIDGSDIYIQGLNVDYLPEAWVKGTIDAEAGTATFASGQYFGAFEYEGTDYDMFFVGYDYDGAGEIADVVFDFDAEAGTLTTDTWIVISAYKDQVSYYEYYQGATITRELPETPELVTLPEGVETEEWTIDGTYRDNSSSDNIVRATEVAFDGTDIYVKGIPFWFEDAWMKGTINAETGIATFPTGQFVGEDEYGWEFIVGSDDGETLCDIEFAYDAEAKTLTQLTSYIVENGDTPDEIAAYGIWTDMIIYAGEPVIEEPVEAPEGLETETYLFTANEIDDVTFDFNTFEVPVSSGSNETYVADGEILEDYVATEGDVKLVITPALKEGKTPTRWWSTKNGPQLRCYYSRLYFSVPEGKTITAIQFNYDGTYWGGKNNGGKVKANSGVITDDASNNVATWTGDAKTVIVGIAAQTRINSIVVSVKNDENLEKSYSYQMQVGFDGNDVYFKGVSDDTSDMWLKGSLSEDGKTVTIPANQYMGEANYLWFAFPYYFTALGVDGKTLEDVVLNYDAENNKFTTNQIVALHDGKRSLGEPYQVFTDIEISKMEEFAATPADPEIVEYVPEATYPRIDFIIPAEDVDGNALLEAKMAYQIFVIKDSEPQPLTLDAALYTYIDEDMTEIPYSYDDSYDIYKGGSRVYLNQSADEIASWSNIGVQSLYYGAGECNKSNIVWLYPDDPVGIADVKTDSKNVVVFDLQGRRVAKTAKGLYIMDGKKVVIK